MILIDTNFLVAGLVPQSPEDLWMRKWLTGSETVALSVIVWAEFLCGPVSAKHSHLASVLFPQPEALLPEDAVVASQLFNGTGRRRGSLADCLIAATCLRLNAAIATNNLNDFRPMEAMGLRIADTG
jgi:predicted nucleic acid-binding protein